MSIPSFWLGMVLVIVFTAKLHLLPSSGMNTVGVNTPWDTFLHMIMPCITLSLGNLATFIRYIRSSTIGELGEEYVLTAQAKRNKGIKDFVPPCAEKHTSPDYHSDRHESGYAGLWFVYH